jgi:hypothetical protein
MIKTEFFFHLLVSCSDIHRALMVAAKVLMSVLAGSLAR